jgi:hypothetical protein
MAWSNGVLVAPIDFFSANGVISLTNTGNEGEVLTMIGGNPVWQPFTVQATNETDPVYSASPAAGITGDDTNRWNVNYTNWSGSPATTDINAANHALSNVFAIHLGGITRTTWPTEVDPADWAQYEASEDVDINNYTLFNVGWIQLGGVYRNSWPTYTNWAESPASSHVNLDGHTISNGTFQGTFDGTASGNATTNHTHTNYLTNAASWSGHPGTQSVNMAGFGFQNVGAIGLGGVTYSNWPTLGSTQFFGQVNVGSTNLFTNFPASSPYPLNLKGVNSARAQYSIIGGVQTTNQISGLPGYVEQFTNSLTPRTASEVPVTNLYMTNGAVWFSLSTSSGNYSDILRLNFWNLNVPLNATIVGIKVFAELANNVNGSAADYSFRLWNNGYTSSVYTVNYSLTTDFTEKTWGMSNSIWGLSSLTPAQVNANDFSIEVWAKATESSGSQFEMRNFKVQIFYTSDELAWTHGINSAGNYTIRNETVEKDILTLGSNGSVAFSELTLGGVTLTNWPGGFDASLPAQLAAVSARVDAVECATNSLNLRVDAVECATNSLNLRVGDIATNAYQPFSGNVVNDAGGTCAITPAHGNLVKIHQDNFSPATNAITITIPTNGFCDLGVNRIGIELYFTGSVSFAESTITNPTALTILTTATNSLFFRRSGNATLWTGRQ